MQELLSHLYVLIPVLDDDKHYWVGDEEVEKLLRHGEGWLVSHPEQQLIAKRYLKRQGHLVRTALAQLVEEDNPNPDSTPDRVEEAVIEQPISLNQQRLDTVVAALKQCGAKRVLDLGCGEGRLLKALLLDKSFEEIVGVDVSHRALEIAQERLPSMQRQRLKLMQGSLTYRDRRLAGYDAATRQRLKLMQGSLTYRDRRLAGYDAATVVEVIEHLDPPRLAGFERVLFEFARPETVIITTPNVEYNVKFELPTEMRHKDHRFEWTRPECQGWANRVAERFGYSVQFLPVGPEDASVGAPTQLALFTYVNRGAGVVAV